MAKTNTSNAFTFLWNVKDFRMLEACTSLDSDTIRSPKFRIYPESVTEWYLVLSNSITEDMDVRLEYSHTPSDAELHLKSELCLVSRMGEEKLLSELDCWMEMGSQSIGSLNTADIMNNHLQNDTLTLRIKMEVGPSRDFDDFDIDSPAENDADYDNKPAEELPVPNTCTTFSRLKTYRKRVIWTVDVTELSPQNPEVSLRVTSPYKDLPGFEIFFAAPDQDDHANLMIQLEEAVFVQCSASVMQAEHEYRVTEPMSYVQAESVCSFTPFVHLGRLRAEQYFNNTKDVLYLLFDFLFSSVKEMQHVVKCSGPDISLPKPPQKSAALEDFGRLYQTGESADVEIRCGGRTFSVHRLILGARSAVFGAMFRTDMSEAKARSAEIEDVDPDTLHRLISFLYSNSVEQLGFLEATSLYTAADKYQVLPLRCHCSVVLMTLIAADNVCESLRFADLQRDRDLLDCAVEFVRDNRVQVLASQDWMDLMKENAALAASVMHKLLMDD